MNDPILTVFLGAIVYGVLTMILMWFMTERFVDAFEGLMNRFYPKWQLIDADIEQIRGDDNFRSNLACSYWRTLELYDENPNVDPIITPYYKTIVDKYIERGLPWFGYTSKKGVMEKTSDFLSLYSDIKRCYDPETYGYIECAPRKDGKLEIIEGHHRLTILRKLRYKTVSVLIKVPKKRRDRQMTWGNIRALQL